MNSTAKNYLSCKAVLRIRDVYPGSGSDHFLVSRIRIRPSFIPDPDSTNRRMEKLTYLFHAGIGHY
jgi:hypothetical protein